MTATTLSATKAPPSLADVHRLTVAAYGWALTRPEVVGVAVRLGAIPPNDRTTLFVEVDFRVGPRVYRFAEAVDPGMERQGSPAGHLRRLLAASLRGAVKAARRKQGGGP